MKTTKVFSVIKDPRYKKEHLCFYTCPVCKLDFYVCLETVMEHGGFPLSFYCSNTSGHRADFTHARYNNEKKWWRRFCIIHETPLTKLVKRLNET